jgi:hypothetical protein
MSIKKQLKYERTLDGLNKELSKLHGIGMSESQEKPKRNVIAGIKNIAGFANNTYKTFYTDNKTSDEPSNLAQALLNTVKDINQTLIIPDGEGGVIRVTVAGARYENSELIYTFHPTERPDTVITSKQINKCKNLEQVQKLFVDAYNSPTQEEIKQEKEEEFKKDLGSVRDIEL